MLGNSLPFVSGVHTKVPPTLLIFVNHQHVFFRVCDFSCLLEHGGYWHRKPAFSGHPLTVSVLGNTNSGHLCLLHSDCLMEQCGCMQWLWNMGLKNRPNSRKNWKLLSYIKLSSLYYCTIFGPKFQYIFDFQFCRFYIWILCFHFHPPYTLRIWSFPLSCVSLSY